MIRLTIEVVPGGDERAKRTLRTMTLENLGFVSLSGRSNECNYLATLTANDCNAPSRRVQVRHIQTDGIEVLCAKALEALGR